MKKTIIPKVKKVGFTPTEYGFRPSKKGGELKIVKIGENFIFRRTRPLKDCFSEDFYRNKLESCKISPPQIDESASLDMGANSSMGNPKCDFAPVSNSSILEQITEPVFSAIPSLKELRSDKNSLLIGFDAEWYDEPRKILSLQFSLVWDDVLYEYICLNHISNGSNFLKLETILSKIFNDLNFQSFDKYKYRKYKACVGFDADGNPKWELFDSEKELYPYAEVIYPLYPDDRNKLVKLQHFKPASKTIAELHNIGSLDRYVNRGWRIWKWAHSVLLFPQRYNVTIVCHVGKVDLSTLFKLGEKTWMNYTQPIQGGAISLNPLNFDILDLGAHNSDYHDIFPVSLSFRDTMAQAPAGYKKLENLGDAIGIKKLNDLNINKDRMDQSLIEEPIDFFEYSARDATITVLYSSYIYGVNKEMSVTLTSAGASVIAKKMSGYMGLKQGEEFDNKWRGVKKVLKGTVKNLNGVGYLNASNKEPVTEKARDVQNYAGLSYHGGLNSSTYIGYITEKTVDFDLCSAYPTALALVGDIDWSNPIKEEFSDLAINTVDDRNAFLKHFYDNQLNRFNPMTPFFARIKFKFPHDKKFPCLPINNGGRIINPLRFGSGYGLDSEDVVYCAGPEIFLALKMGAEIFIERGYLLNTLFINGGLESRSIGYALKSLVKERAIAKKYFNENKLWELVLKNIANGSAYGKIAQNIIEKRGWNTYTFEMENLSESIITNPVTASLATSFVRAELYAIMTELDNSGYKVYSVTTDGFITNCTDVEVLENSDMFGFSQVARSSRQYLTDDIDAKIWEAKHHQDAFYNATTRGNMALNLEGVCAHNSTKTPFPSGSLEDRSNTIFSWLSRTGPVAYRDVRWTTHKELSLGANFSIRDVERKVSMDFDMKRKPLKDSFYTENVIFADNIFEVACFDTVPFDTIDEANLYEKKKRLCSVLRTEFDWSIFWNKLENNSFSNHITKRGLEWTKLTSCIQGARNGLWTIPELDRTDISIQDKLNWINSFKLSKYNFKLSNWKDARKSDRLGNMLPFDVIEDFLIILGAVDIKMLEK